MALFRHKRWLCVVGIVLGVAFVARIALWLRNQQRLCLRRQRPARLRW